MSDNNQTDGLILPLCINVGPVQVPVTHVQKELEDLIAKRDAITADIEKADPDVTSTLEKLKRDLNGVNAAIIRLDDPMRARLGHIYTPIADSA